jgi:hypothetical protein
MARSKPIPVLVAGLIDASAAGLQLEGAEPHISKRCSRVVLLAFRDQQARAVQGDAETGST